MAGELLTARMRDLVTRGWIIDPYWPTQIAVIEAITRNGINLEALYDYCENDVLLVLACIRAIDSGIVAQINTRPARVILELVKERFPVFGLKSTYNP